MQSSRENSVAKGISLEPKQIDDIPSLQDTQKVSYILFISEYLQ